MTLPMKEHLARLRLLAMHAFVHQHLPEGSRLKRTITQDNREHRNRYPDGSPEAMERINAAALKRLARQRKVAGNG